MSAQAELDSEFDSLLNQEDEAGESDVMVVAQQGPAYQPPKNPKDLSSIFGSEGDSMGPLADDSGVAYGEIYTGMVSTQLTRSQRNLRSPALDLS